MPYRSTNDLPDSVKDVLPSHAQDIFLAAFTSAYEGYKNSSDRRGYESRDQVAFKVAWSAVKRQYKKGGDGKWHPKDG